MNISLLSLTNFTVFTVVSLLFFVTAKQVSQEYAQLVTLITKETWMNCSLWANCKTFKNDFIYMLFDNVWFNLILFRTEGNSNLLSVNGYWCVWCQFVKNHLLLFENKDNVVILNISWSLIKDSDEEELLGVVLDKNWILKITSIIFVTTQVRSYMHLHRIQDIWKSYS